jgi:hypothetical protein
MHNENKIYFKDFGSFMDSNFTGQTLVKDNDSISRVSGIAQIGYSLKRNSIIYNKYFKDDRTGLYSCHLNELNYSITGKDFSVRLLKSDSYFYYAFDWVHDLIYKCDGSSLYVSHIEQMDFQYRIRKTHLTLYTFVINPIKSLIFWTEVEFASSSEESFSIIFRSKQDGSDVKPLIKKLNSTIKNLAIDFKTEILYWIDGNTNLGSIDFEANNQTFINGFENNEYFSIYNLEFFENNLYYLYYGSINNTERIAIYRIDILDNKHQLIANFEGKEIVHSFKIVDYSLQPDAYDECQDAKCSHLCLPINSSHYHCVCPEPKLNENCFESVCIFQIFVVYF